MVTPEHAAALIRALRNIAWSDERIPNDETGAAAHGTLLEFAQLYPQLVANDFEFLELKEYIEAQQQS